MRFGSERVGPRGFALLGATGFLGLVLAVHGYGHGTAVSGVATPLATPAKVTKARAASTRLSTSSTTASTTPAASPTSSTSNQKLGPLLSSTQYASAAYQVYPGQESSQARLATAGFDVHVTPASGGTITVSVSATGSTQGAQTSTYPATDHVYFIEASFGDDSGNSEYNNGDDGVVVTDASGRIVQ